MSLKEEIAKFMQQFLDQVPAKVQTIMEEEANRLAQSGIAEKSLNVGDKAPAFSLPNASGKIVASTALLSRGPLLVSFYRGGW